ncbi:MAG: hypothetical protein ONB48_06440 [candidate division KSB1 bacterium]|nr:hypothetical protein [candidate division KSB1 bacterium]MDZ7273179.1 hypothetical protein [candidate division KSB1 bacterium]MDZ7285281.1 hypothetical protein [candidate division KSB1 bacterium]MDZ7298313.1 hypothetical protein [candidate division KSB1 bacterium]MDZ7307388.1 hypothetical protein [candidate division KSB1 bacterium]
MVPDDLTGLFREKLRDLAKTQKYARRFTPEEEERVCRAFALALENPSLSATLLYALLTGERA